MITSWMLPLPRDPPRDDVVPLVGILKKPGPRSTPSGRKVTWREVTWPEDHDAYDIVDGSPALPLSESGQQERCEWLEERQRYDLLPWPQVPQRLGEPEASPPQPEASEAKPQALEKPPQPWKPYLCLRLDIGHIPLIAMAETGFFWY